MEMLDELNRSVECCSLPRSFGELMIEELNKEPFGAVAPNGLIKNRRESLQWCVR